MGSCICLPSRFNVSALERRSSFYLLAWLHCGYKAVRVMCKVPSVSKPHLTFLLNSLPPPFLCLSQVHFFSCLLTFPISGSPSPSLHAFLFPSFLSLFLLFACLPLSLFSSLSLSISPLKFLLSALSESFL